jgi:hypothetical protein
MGNKKLRRLVLKLLLCWGLIILTHGTLSYYFDAPWYAHVIVAIVLVFVASCVEWTDETTSVTYSTAVIQAMALACAGTLWLLASGYLL